MIKIELNGVEEVAAGINRMATEIQPQILAMMESASTETAQLMKSNIPNRSGSLANSIDYSLKIMGNTIESEIGPNDSAFGGRPVGRAVELGRTPGGGFPNWFDIAARYGVSTSVAFLIAKKIQREGTMGIKFVERTFSKIVNLFEKYGLEVVYRIANRF